MSNVAREQRIVAARAAGETLGVIAAREGLSKQGVSAIAKRAAHTGPATVRRSYVHRDGYRILVMSDGRQVREHRHVWETAHGPIPRGIEIHHRNGVKTDNRLENLEAVDRMSHAKKHSGARMNDAGEWVKPCARCRKVKPVETGYYRHTRAADGYIQPYCRECVKAAQRKRDFERRRAGRRS